MDRAAWQFRLLNLIDLAGPGDPDEWGTYVLWDRDPEHPMKVGQSLCPRRRMDAIQPHVPWPIEIVLVVPMNLEAEFRHSFEQATLPYEMKHSGWMEWYLDPALVALVEGYDAASRAPCSRASAPRAWTVASKSS